MNRIHREARLDRLAQCPTGHDTRHYYKWLDEIDELTKQNAKLLEALKLAVSEFDRIDDKTPWTETEPEWWLAFSTVARYARQAIAEAEGQS